MAGSEDFDSKTAEGVEKRAYSSFSHTFNGSGSWEEIALDARGLPLAFWSINASGGAEVEYEVYHAATLEAAKTPETRKSLVPSASVTGGAGQTFQEEFNGGVLLIRVRSTAEFDLDAHCE